jgi:hypothetical protein
MNIHGNAKKINQKDFGCDIAEIHNVVSINAPNAAMNKYKMIASRTTFKNINAHLQPLSSASKFLSFLIGKMEDTKPEKKVKAINNSIYI